MKTLQQRLQSRISLRRNCIRETEDEVVHNHYLFRLTNNRQFLGNMLDAKEAIRVLAADQKIDKELYAMGLEQDAVIRATQRAVQISANLYLQLIDAGIEPVL